MVRRLFESIGFLPERISHPLWNFDPLRVSGKPDWACDAAREKFRMKHKHRVAEWNARGLILDTWSASPDSVSGRNFLKTIDTDSIHEIATGLIGHSTAAVHWLRALAAHPKCDKATGWSLFLSAEPEYYEGQIRKTGFRPEIQRGETDTVSLLDLVHGRLVAHNFATNELRVADHARPGRHRRFQHAAQRDGHRLHWEMPHYAYVLSHGRKPQPKYELWEAEKIMVPFMQWVQSHPEI